MTAKELIEMLECLDPNTPVLREYDGSFIHIELTIRELYAHLDPYRDKPNYDTYWNSQHPPLITQALIIHDEYTNVNEELQDPNRKIEAIKDVSKVTAAELEKVLPKIKHIFEADSKFYKRLK